MRAVVPGCGMTTKALVGLVSGQVYHFAVTSYDAGYVGNGTDLVEGHESWFSIEKAATAP